MVFITLGARLNLNILSTDLAFTTRVEALKV
jgi:hypothetical protein